MYYALVGSGPVCSALVGSGLVCSTLVGSCFVYSALVLCSAGFASVPGPGTSSWTWPSVPPQVPPPLHRPPGLFQGWSVWKPLLGGGGLCHESGCPSTTWTLALHLRLHFPSFTAPTTHTHPADCTNQTLHRSHSCLQLHSHLKAITHTLHKTFISSSSLPSIVLHVAFS